MRFVILLITIMLQVLLQAKKQTIVELSDISELKDFKKILRTKTNVMVLFVNVPKYSLPIVDVFKDTAVAMRGQATLAIVDCSSGGKKLCKNLKIGSDKNYYIRHYKDGEYHKNYDRAETISAMSNFLRDPTGDLPWEEDSTAKNIFHLQDREALNKFLKRSVTANKKSLIMFYAPWCGYCKTLKPEYVAAATDLTGEAFLAAIDVAKPGNSKVRQLYNITGFPTLLYFERAQLRYTYNGDNKRTSIVNFVRDPLSHEREKQKEVSEGWSSESDVEHLTVENFDSIISKVEHALVVFYAPWCGHCKRIKPEVEKAATRIKNEKINGLLAAVDATKHGELTSRFSVRGYPTLKYFFKGEYKFDAAHLRQEEQIIAFMKDPQEPPPPPPPDTPWSEESSSVRHLDASTFKNTLRKIKHAIVMFYAPWCGHCKSTKPEFTLAAERFEDELMVAFAAVDCTTEQKLCATYEVKGYPSIKYFSYFNREVKDYTSGRKETDFVQFIHSQMGNHETQQKAAKTPQEAGFGVNVVLATDDNFEKMINENKFTFVMFYATWCGHCVEAKPALSKLATTLKNENHAVKVIALEASENQKVADFAGISTLPTFKIYGEGKHIGDYEGDRSYEDLLQFCKSHVRFNDEL